MRRDARNESSTGGGAVGGPAAFRESSSLARDRREPAPARAPRPAARVGRRRRPAQRGFVGLKRHQLGAERGGGRARAQARALAALPRHTARCPCRRPATSPCSRCSGSVLSAHERATSGGGTTESHGREGAALPEQRARLRASAVVHGHRAAVQLDREPREEQRDRAERSSRRRSSTRRRPRPRSAAARAGFVYAGVPAISTRLGACPTPRASRRSGPSQARAARRLKPMRRRSCSACPGSTSTRPRRSTPRTRAGAERVVADGELGRDELGPAARRRHDPAREREVSRARPRPDVRVVELEHGPPSPSSMVRWRAGGRLMALTTRSPRRRRRRSAGTAARST